MVSVDVNHRERRRSVKSSRAVWTVRLYIIYRPGSHSVSYSSPLTNNKPHGFCGRKSPRKKKKCEELCQELCEQCSHSVSYSSPLPNNKPHGFCGRKSPTKEEEVWRAQELCEQWDYILYTGLALIPYPILPPSLIISHMVSVDVNHHERRRSVKSCVNSEIIYYIQAWLSFRILFFPPP